jgi:hypothetical protein
MNPIHKNRRKLNDSDNSKNKITYIELTFFAVILTVQRMLAIGNIETFVENLLMAALRVFEVLELS